MDEPRTSDKREVPEQGQPATPGPATVSPPPGLLATGTERRRDGKYSGDDSGKGGLSGDSGTKELQFVLPILSQTGTVIVSAPTPSNQPSTSLASGLGSAQSGKEPEDVGREASVYTIPSTPPRSGKGSKWRRRLSAFGFGQSGTESAIIGDSSTAVKSGGAIERSEASGSWRLKVGTILGRSKPVLLAKKSKQNLGDFLKRDSVAEGGGVIEPEEA